MKETNLGEDWRVDPVLREACQPVVDLSCRDVSEILIKSEKMEISKTRMIFNIMDYYLCTK